MRVQASKFIFEQEDMKQGFRSRILGLISFDVGCETGEFGFNELFGYLR